MRSIVAAVALFALAIPASALAAGPTSPTPTPTPVMFSSGSSSSSSSMGSSMVAASAPETYRPEGRSFGIGAGWTFPADLGKPDTVSATFRLGNGMAIEPIARLSVASNSGKVGTAKTSSSDFGITAGADFRKDIAGRHQVDFVGILGPSISLDSASSKDATGAKTTSTGFGIGATWGLGVELWPKDHWSITFDAVNPLISINSDSGKTAGVKTSTTGFFVGTVFDPTVRLMTHIYY
jgi:hypothetical protein